MLISIGTAYMCFAFSNILEYLQVLVLLFIVPLFGTVVIGMLWKRATPTAGWVGFLCAILTSVGMWGYVHSFPDGWRPEPKLSIGSGAVVTLDKTGDNITRIVVEQGSVDSLNIPQAASTGKLTSDLSIPAATTDKGQEHKVAVLAPDVTVGGESTKFGVQAVPVLLKSGVQVVSSNVTRSFVPSALNSQHTKVIARSDKAQGMAVNMYTAFWSLMVSIIVTVAVSLVTKPKPDAELKNLVMGLTPLPDEGPCAWYRNPKLWAFAVLVILVAINVIFW